jgi:NAD+ diphosphatase
MLGSPHLVHAGDLMPLHAHLNTFAGNPLDRAGERRREPEWLADQLEAATTWAVAFWNGAPLVEEQDGEARLARVEPVLAAELARGDERLLFMGLDDQERAVFALDLEGGADPAEGVLEGRGRFENLRELAAILPAGESGIAATARAVFEWRRRHRFCSACGQPTQVTEAGWKRHCPACGVEHFPRTDPVVIMLPVRGDRCLLGRQPSWPPGRFSALAGFMEPGESIESACAREVFEEAALRVSAVHYHSSQPWPFPTNLMIGLIAEVEEGEARADQSELEAVVWLKREDVRAALREEGEVRLPPPLAIARALIAHWAEG